MATKEETLARHSIVNGTSQPDIDHVHDAEHGLHGVAHVAEPVDEADPLAPPHIILREAAAQLDAARFEARTCRAATLASRVAFGKVLAAWNASGPAPQTQAELMKEHIASNQAERAKRYAAGHGVHYPGVGRTAKALAGGNMRNGGGASYRRGAFTRAQAIEIEAGKLRAANAAVKPPSQR
jgi:hypothetical protein